MGNNRSKLIFCTRHAGANLDCPTCEIARLLPLIVKAVEEDIGLTEATQEEKT